MTGGRGSHWGGNAGGSMPRVTALAPAVARLPTGRTSPGGLALVRHCGLPIRRRCNATRGPAEGLLQIVRVPVADSKPTAGALPRGSTIFRLPSDAATEPRFPRPDAQNRLYQL